MIVQKIENKIVDKYELAYKYFNIIAVLNNINLVKRDVQLLSYAAAQDKPINEVRREFVKKFDTSKATVGNIISKLYKLHILQKNKKEITINPVLLINFDKDLTMNLLFKHVNTPENGD